MREALGAPIEEESDEHRLARLADEAVGDVLVGELMVYGKQRLTARKEG